MTDYSKLVKALRCCAGVHTTKCPDYGDSWCGGNCLDNHLVTAAAAIEELQAELAGSKDAIRILKHNLEMKKPKRGEIVRCRECKWYKEGYDIDGKWFSRCNGSVRTYGHTTPDWFCADGERKAQE